MTSSSSTLDFSIKSHPFGFRFTIDLGGADGEKSRVFSWGQIDRLFEHDPQPTTELMESFRAGNLQVSAKYINLLANLTFSEPDASDPAEFPQSSQTTTIENELDHLADRYAHFSGLLTRVHDHAEEAGHAVASSLPAIVDHLRALERLGYSVARIPMSTPERLRNDISISSLISDIVVVVEDSDINQRTGQRAAVDGRIYTMPDGKTVAMNVNFVFSDSSVYSTFFDEAEPLVQSRRLVHLPLPSSTFEVDDPELEARVLRAATWMKPFQHNMPGGGLSERVEVLEGALPYLRDVPYEVLAGVLEEEAESLAALRKRVRRLTVDASKLSSEPSSGDELPAAIIRDELNDGLTQIDRLLRKQRKSRIARGASITLGAAGLGLMSLFSLGVPSVDLLKYLSVGAGASGAIKMLWNTDSGDEATSDPLYVLWRLRHEAAKF